MASNAAHDNPCATGGLSPSMRAALDNLEREFAELLRAHVGPQASHEAERRMEVARQMLDISDAR